MAWSNAKPHTPLVFVEIIKNQSERAALKALSVIPFGRYKELKLDMDRNLRPSAERALRWNTDKGNKA